MDVTLVITSCNRPQLLSKTLESFVKMNTYPIHKTIIIDDSGKVGCNDQVLKPYEDILHITSIYNPSNIGQIQSIDKVYALVETDWIFHCEEDWLFIQPSFIEKSFKVFNENPDEKIITVWLRPHTCTNGHKFIVDTLDRGYYIVRKDHSYMGQGKKYVWGGFTFNPGLRRTRDCMLFHPYMSTCEKEYIGNRESIGEYSVNQKYLEAGYYSMILADPKGHVTHIGWNAHVPLEWEK